MPVIRSSEQSSRTLEEFYLEISSDDKSLPETGLAMLSFLKMANEIFIQTSIFGLTSHYRLLLKPEDIAELEWYIRISSLSHNEYYIDYKVPKIKSPWEDGLMQGMANSLDKARQFLLIAMNESGGWKGNSELDKLFKKYVST